MTALADPYLSARASPLTHKNLEAHILSSSPKQRVVVPKPDSVSTGSDCEICRQRETKAKPVLMICQMMTCKRAYHPGCVNMHRAPKGQWFCNRCQLDRRMLKRTSEGRLQLQAIVLKNDDEEDDDAPLVDARSAKAKDKRDGGGGDSDESCGSACKLCRGRQKPDKMLQCDGRCKKFFHTWCVGLGAVPKGQWLCSACGKAPTVNKGGRPRKSRPAGPPFLHARVTAIPSSIHIPQRAARSRKKTCKRDGNGRWQWA
jgi:hypothetical protein